MKPVIDTLQRWWTSRRRAERLIQARLEAQRGGAGLSATDETWLEARLARDPELQIYWQEQQALQALLTDQRRASVGAPEGFSARVLMAAKSRPKQSLPGLDGPAAEGRSDERSTPWVWVTAAGAVAVALIAVVVQPPAPVAPVPSTPVAVSGQSGSGLLAPDFVVRAQGIGAAQARAQIVTIVEQHGGRIAEDDGALQARLPRAELVPAMQKLAKSGTFKVTPVKPGAVPAETDTVVLRFVLD